MVRQRSFMSHPFCLQFILENRTRWRVGMLVAVMSSSTHICLLIYKQHTGLNNCALDNVYIGLRNALFSISSCILHIFILICKQTSCWWNPQIYSSAKCSAEKITPPPLLVLAINFQCTSQAKEFRCYF